MNTLARGVVLCLMIVGPVALHAQISPGELSSAHASLEGVDKCTACHSFGKNIDNEKCLACHTDIAERITRRSGVHGGVASHKCVECHKEHHGKSFAIVRFDTTSFDHAARAGFTLAGKHGHLACVACHRTANIKDARVRGNASRLKAGTFLGLGRECLDCHKDQHGGQFKQACTTCHNQEGWKPVPGFSHDKARFTLTGRHQQVECGKCHRAPAPGGVVAYTRLSFASCSACHKDPHAGKFKKSCESCHVTTGWSAGVAAHFDHSTTRFPLRGKHSGLPCERCHRGKETGTARFVIKQFGKCADCHADPHRGKFVPGGVSQPCEQCHVESGWKEGGAKTFDHGKTHFALHDAHASAKCEKCHGMVQQPGLKPSLAARQTTYACDDCHRDMHEGQFVKAARTPCERCHTERTFMPPLFSLADHQRASFPLTGAHGAVACVECHKKVTLNGKSVRQFAWDRDPVCKDCHQDVHRGQFDKFVRDGCRECHTSTAWTEVKFSHETTAFKLTGKHAGVPCYRCHGPGGSTAPLAQWRFSGTPQKCVDCHGQNVRPL